MSARYPTDAPPPVLSAVGNSLFKAMISSTTSDRDELHVLRLSAQERRVLVELARGHSNKFIAYDLGLATSTVAALLARAARKLGCTSRVALIRAGRALAHQVTARHDLSPDEEAPGHLTSTEWDIAALALQGQTTAQIATARGVARATVSSQLQSIYRKLGVGSRAELACKLDERPRPPEA